MTYPTSGPAVQLRTAVAGNAAFSLVTGTATAVLAAPLADAMEVPAWLLVIAGSGVVVFGAVLAVTLRRRGISPALGTVALVADGAWVLAAVAVLVGFPEALTATGRLLLGTVTVVVGGFFVAEWRGLRGIAR